ncbi:hypothetical protein [Falsiruegeria mediterranea]|uniref:hypothetical protein n=1 Tax=Falsiruegeria mediterranea TaxID=1280832 RepID=UPI0015F2841F|nr:hypothetical protein [Falsiruegeria mediterranea]
MRHVSITHHRSGRIDICQDGHHVACVSDPDTIGQTLQMLGLQPDDFVHVQTKDGRDDKIAARAYIKEST